jgi:hypothetical protein
MYESCRNYLRKERKEGYMKLTRMLVVCAVVAAPAAIAQKWEVGGGVGGGFYTSQDVSAPGGGSASAKIQNNVAGGIWLANNSSGRWGGEARYDFQRGALQLSSAGTEATFGAETHTLHYDVIWHGAPSGSKVRPFIAIGGGVKVYRGTGAEVVYQPLSNYALLTRARDMTGVISVGAGFKVQMGPHVQLRFDFHDYLTPFPKHVIVPNQGSSAGGWIQDFVPIVGLSFTGRAGE